MMAPRPYRPRAALTLVELVVVVVIIGVLIVFILPGSGGHSPEYRRRLNCWMHLRQISLGLQNYASATRELPPAYTTDSQGRPLHSWRTLILPYIDQEALYREIDLTKPWDHPANAKALSKMPDVYRCKSVPEDEYHTTYLAIVTPESCLRATKGRRFSDIEDGTANTLMLVEVDADHAVPWMAPMDADEALFLSLGGSDGLTDHGRSANVIYADGHDGFLPIHPEQTPPAVRRQLISIAGDDPRESDETANTAD